MPRERRICAEKVLRRLRHLESDVDSSSETSTDRNSVHSPGDNAAQEHVQNHEELELCNEISDDEFVDNYSDGESSASDDVEEGADDILSSSGISWSQAVLPVPHLQRNDIRFHQDATMNPVNEQQAFSLCLNNRILGPIQRWTNRRLKFLKCRMITF